MKKRLFSILLAVCLVICAFSVTAFAAEVKEVSTKADLDSAIASAADGDTICLTADIDYIGTASLEINKAITLDLGDHTLTTYGTYGGLRLMGGCTLKNGTLAHKGTVTAIKAWNVASIENLVIDVAFKEEGKVIGGIVIQKGTDVRIDTIKNVTIKGKGLTNGIETYECGNATENVIGSMENVTIEAVGTGMLISAPCGTATNCTIKGGVSGIEIWIKGTYSATLDLKGCTVEGGTQAVYAHDEFSSNSDIVNNGTLELTADDKTEFTSENGAQLTQNIVRAEDYNILGTVGSAKVAKVGNDYFTTLSAAVAAANAVEGEVTITLLGNVTWETGAGHGSTPLVTADSKAVVTIDGQDNYTLTATGAGVGSLRAANGTVLTFQNMKIDDESVSYAENAWEFTYLEFGGRLVFNDVDFLSGIQVDADNGTAPETTAVFTDCTFQPAASTTSEYSVWFGNGTATFTNCEFTGNRGLKIHEAYGSEVKSVTVDGCTFTTTGKPGIVIGDLNADTAVTVKDSTFIGGTAGDQNLYALETDTSIGTFTMKFDVSNTIQDSNSASINNFEAQIGDYLYPTLIDAFAIATNGETVKLIADITYDEADKVHPCGANTGYDKYGQYYNTIIYTAGTQGDTAAKNTPSSVNAVLDLNGHSITNIANETFLFILMDNTKLTIKDSVGGGSVNNGNYPAIWTAGTETLLTIESGKFTTTGSDGLLHVTHSSDAVITGGEFSTSADDASGLIWRNERPFNNPNYFQVGSATVTVTGGTFYGFNPENIPDDYEEVHHFNAVAEGYIVKVDAKNEPAVYTVIENKDLTEGTYLSEPDVASGYVAAENDDGTWTISKIVVYVPSTTKPAEKDDECDGTLKDNCPAVKYSDVDTSLWYHEAIDYALNEGLMNGMTATTFAPNGSFTRAMMWTVLARQAGVDTDGGETWYSVAQAWAVKNGVSDGTDPMGSITREQLVTMLWRYLGEPEAKGDLSDFVDGDDVSEWAEEAMIWAVANKVISGRGNGILAPQGLATRAEVAQIFKNYFE